MCARRAIPRLDGRLATAAAIVRLLRPRHWIKSAFVLAPLLFASAFTRPEAVGQALLAAAVFALAASLVYVANDLRDEAVDRLHPRKRTERPLAAGELGRGTAWGLLGLLAAGLAGACLAWPVVAPGLLAYVGLQLAYAAGLKAVPLVELACVAAGFVLRTWVGAAAIGVPLSGWMAACTFALALHLAVGKRHHELAHVGAAARPVLATYGARPLGWALHGSAIVAVASYGAFALLVRPELAATLAPAAAGVMRHVWLVWTGRADEGPTELAWRDPGLLAVAVLWALLAALALRP